MAEPQPSGPQSAPPRRLRQRWMVVVTIGWGLVLVGGIVWSAYRGEPTVREQTTVAQAVPVVDRATADVVAAATADGLAVVAVSGFDRAADCSVTIIRGGARYQRTIMAMVAPGTEQALLERVRGRLPAGYQTHVRTGALPRLTADAGFYVALTGAVVAPGQVRFVVDTGACRAEGDMSAAVLPSGAKPAEGTAGPLAAAADALLARLALPAERWSTQRVPCPGGVVTTVEAVGAQGALPASLAAQREALAAALDSAVRPAEPGVVVAATPELFAYRVASVGLGARSVNGHVVVTATSGCA